MATGRMRFVAPPVAWTLTAASAGLKPSSFRSTEESEDTGERAPLGLKRMMIDPRSHTFASDKRAIYYPSYQ